MSEDRKTRRQVIKAVAVGAIGLAVPAVAEAQVKQKPPSVAPDLVKEFVVAGHANLPRVKEMLEAMPQLLNACWDWGGGDFESALEGAGHMGNREIARFLISKGARPSLFQFAMLGELELVKVILKTHPELATSKGPHGIPLLAHAKVGGDEAKAVVEYLEKLS